MIRTIFFDVGGTLIRPNPSVGAIYADVAQRHGVSKEAQELDQRFRAAWKNQKLKSHLIDKNWWEAVVRHVFKDALFEDFGAFFADLYAEFDEPARWEVFPDVHPALTKLKEKGLRLVVGSNWDERLPGLLKNLTLDAYFEKQFVSFQMGIAKPSPLFFQQALQSLGETPIQAMHVGDDEVEDVACAESAGLRAYLIDRTKKPINSRMLSSLEDVLLRI